MLLRPIWSFQTKTGPHWLSSCISSHFRFPSFPFSGKFSELPLLVSLIWSWFSIFIKVRLWYLSTSFIYLSFYLFSFCPPSCSLHFIVRTIKKGCSCWTWVYYRSQLWGLWWFVSHPIMFGPRGCQYGSHIDISWAELFFRADPWIPGVGQPLE